MIKRRAFITGIYRSGTTLLEKILSNHPQIKIASQPFPYLLFRAKTDFYNSIGIIRKYPLDDMFNESSYTNSDFISFLDSFQLSSNEVRNLLDDMKDYFGCWTPDLINKWHTPSGGTLNEIYNEMHLAINDLLLGEEASVVGAKEIFAEEYIPYFLQRNHDVVLIIRDPREIVTSLNFGNGEYYTGKIRPVLFTIRAWRKSVAFALQFLNKPGFHVLKFEDFINRPEQLLNQITGSWEIQSFGKPNEIQNQNGEIWKGNSSFEEFNGIEKSSGSNYLSWLDEPTVKYIESTCYPELIAMGYPVTINETDIVDHIVGYEEPFVIERADFESDYSFSESAKHLEIQRIAYLNKELLNDNFSSWFIFKDSYEKLKSRKCFF